MTTEAGQWLIDRARWDSGMRGFFIRVWNTGSPQDIATIVRMIEEQAREEAAKDKSCDCPYLHPKHEVQP